MKSPVIHVSVLIAGMIWPEIGRCAGLLRLKRQMTRSNRFCRGEASVTSNDSAILLRRAQLCRRSQRNIANSQSPMRNRQERCALRHHR
ncbi:MAG: hypothetical protein DMG13_28725 [Acidobacteria bacterium]|nr:MAG: hypothetical protein DMG13_28725 [Acidobacteriota bacterium]